MAIRRVMPSFWHKHAAVHSRRFDNAKRRFPQPRHCRPRRPRGIRSGMDNAEKEALVAKLADFLEKLPFSDLTNDLTFKALFANAKHKVALTSLLESFLPLPKGSVILDVQTKNPELEPKNRPASEKSFILDIRVEFERTGPGGATARETCNVELQAYKQECLLERVFSYNARIYSGQLKRGGNWRDISPVYSLVFSKHNLPPLEDDPQMGHLFTLNKEGGWRMQENGTIVQEARSPQAPLKRIEKGAYIVVVELAKLPPAPAGKIDLRGLWCYLLLKSGGMDADECKRIIEQGGLVMAEALKGLWEVSQDRVLREAAEAREKEMRNIRTNEYVARERGFAEGEAKGRAEGEAKTRMEHARRMLEKGAETDFVCAVTGLSEKEVEALKESLAT